MTDLNAIKGDTTPIQITIVRENSPVNLTGVKLWFTVKSSRLLPDEDAVLQKGTINTSLTGIQIEGDPTDGIATIILDPEDSEGFPLGLQIYEWDIQMVEPDTTVTTIAAGRISFSDDVTDAA